VVRIHDGEPPTFALCCQLSPETPPVSPTQSGLASRFRYVRAVFEKPYDFIGEFRLVTGPYRKLIDDFPAVGGRVQGTAPHASLNYAILQESLFRFRDGR
jgi:hypothetical protein